MRALALLCVCLGSSGCYLLQAAGGQYELIHSARSLKSVVKDPATNPRVKALLVKVPGIKHYGQQRGLRPTENYSDYVDLHRSAAVYVVQGCEPLKFSPRRWTFPIVGSVPYLGYFDEQNARRFAADLAKDEQIDVTVRTASAYSTLGWFKDPVLSTMIPEGPDALGELVNVILHESVHATVYVEDQSSFDESFASFVADHLTRDYLLTMLGPDAPETKAYFEGEEHGARYLAALRIAHDELQQLFESNELSREEKLERKEARYVALQKQLGTRRKFNNADLAGIRTYDSGRAAFERLLVRCHSWWRVLAAVRSLKPGDFEQPQQPQFDAVIDALADRACR
ncbi:MAG: aminopeptidase [Archangium sp.]